MGMPVLGPPTSTPFSPIAPSLRQQQPAPVSFNPMDRGSLRPDGSAYGLEALRGRMSETYEPPAWAKAIPTVDPTFQAPGDAGTASGYSRPGLPERVNINPFGNDPVGSFLGGDAGVALGLVPGEQRGGSYHGIATTPITMQNFSTWGRERLLALATSIMGKDYQQPLTAGFNEQPGLVGQSGDVTEAFVSGVAAAGDLVLKAFDAPLKWFRDSNAMNRGKSVRDLFAKGQATPFVTEAITTAIFGGSERFTMDAIRVAAAREGIDYIDAIAKRYDLPPQVVAAIAQNPYMTDAELGTYTDGQALSVDPTVNMGLEIAMQGAMLAVGGVGIARGAAVLGKSGVGALEALGTTLRGGAVAGEVGMGARAAGSAGWMARKALQLNSWNTTAGWTIGGAEWGIKQLAIIGGNDELVKAMDRLMWQMPLSMNPGWNLIDGFSSHPIDAYRNLRQGQVAIGRRGGPGYVGQLDLKGMALRDGSTGETMTVRLAGRDIKLGRDSDEFRTLGRLRDLTPDDMHGLFFARLGWSKANLERVFGDGNAYDLTWDDARNALFHVALEAVRESKGPVGRLEGMHLPSMAERTSAFVRDNAKGSMKMLEDNLKGTSDSMVKLFKGDFWNLAARNDTRMGEIKASLGEWDPDMAFLDFASWVRASKIVRTAVESRKAAKGAIPVFRQTVNREFMAAWLKELEKYGPDDVVPLSMVNQLKRFGGAVEQRGKGGMLVRGRQAAYTRTQLEEIADSILEADDLAQKAANAVPRDQAAAYRKGIDPGQDPLEDARVLGISTTQLDVIRAMAAKAPEDITALPPDRLVRIVAADLGRSADSINALGPADAWATVIDWWNGRVAAATDTAKLRDGLDNMAQAIRSRAADGRMDGADAAAMIAGLGRIRDEVLAPLDPKLLESRKSLYQQWQATAEEGLMLAADIDRHLADEARGWRVAQGAPGTVHAVPAGIPDAVIKGYEALIAKVLKDGSPFLSDFDRQRLEDPNVHPLLKHDILMGALSPTDRVTLNEAMLGLGGREPRAVVTEMLNDGGIDPSDPAAGAAEAAARAEAYIEEGRQLGARAAQLGRRFQTLGGAYSDEMRDTLDRIGTAHLARKAQAKKGQKVPAIGTMSMDPEEGARKSVSAQNTERAAATRDMARAQAQLDAAEKALSDAAGQPTAFDEATMEWSQAKVFRDGKDAVKLEAARAHAADLRRTEGAITRVHWDKRRAAWIVDTAQPKPAAPEAPAQRPALTTLQPNDMPEPFERDLDRLLASTTSADRTAHNDAAMDLQLYGTANIENPAYMPDGELDPLRAMVDRRMAELEKDMAATPVRDPGRDPRVTAQGILADVQARFRRRDLAGQSALETAAVAEGADPGLIDQAVQGRIDTLGGTPESGGAMAADTGARTQGGVATPAGPPQIASLDEVATLANRGPLYFRWSRDIDADTQPGFVSRGLTDGSEAEAGVSASVVDPSQPGMGMDTQYGFEGRRAYLVRGEKVAEGWDGEPLLRSDSIEVVAEVPYDLMEHARLQRYPGQSYPRGADPVLTRPMPKPEPHGFFPDPATKAPIGYQLAVVDANRVITSKDAGFDPDLQPRMRQNRESSDQQIAQIANKPDPNLLLGTESGAEGMPVILPDGQVLAGNGRVSGLRQAYADGTAGAYRDAIPLQMSAEGMDAPVIVRVIDVDRPTAVRLAVHLNFATGMPMADKALGLARLLTDEDIQKLSIGSSQSLEDALRSGSNNDFVLAFQEHIPEQYRGTELRDLNDELSQQGIALMTATLMARFTNASATPAGQILIATLFEGDPEIRSLAAGMDAIGALIQAQIESVGRPWGGVAPAFAADIVPALQRVFDLRKNLPNAKAVREALETVSMNLESADLVELTPAQRVLARNLAMLGEAGAGGGAGALRSLLRDVARRIRGHEEAGVEAAPMDLFGSVDQTVVRDPAYPDVVNDAFRSMNVGRPEGKQFDLIPDEAGFARVKDASGAETARLHPVVDDPGAVVAAATPTMTDAVLTGNDWRMHTEALDRITGRVVFNVGSEAEATALRAFLAGDDSARLPAAYRVVDGAIEPLDDAKYARARDLANREYKAAKSKAQANAYLDWLETHTTIKAEVLRAGKTYAADSPEARGIMAGEGFGDGTPIPNSVIKKIDGYLKAPTAGDPALPGLRTALAGRDFEVRGPSPVALPETPAPTAREPLPMAHPKFRNIESTEQSLREAKAMLRTMDELSAWDGIVHWYTTGRAASDEAAALSRMSPEQLADLARRIDLEAERRNLGGAVEQTIGGGQRSRPAEGGLTVGDVEDWFRANRDLFDGFDQRAKASQAVPDPVTLETGAPPTHANALDGAPAAAPDVRTFTTDADYEAAYPEVAAAKAAIEPPRPAKERPEAYRAAYLKEREQKRAHAQAIAAVDPEVAAEIERLRAGGDVDQDRSTVESHAVHNVLTRRQNAARSAQAPEARPTEIVANTAREIPDDYEAVTGLSPETPHADLAASEAVAAGTHRVVSSSDAVDQRAAQRATGAPVNRRQDVTEINAPDAVERTRLAQQARDTAAATVEAARARLDGLGPIEDAGPQREILSGSELDLYHRYIDSTASPTAPNRQPRNVNEVIDLLTSLDIGMPPLKGAMSPEEMETLRMALLRVLNARLDDLGIEPSTGAARRGGVGVKKSLSQGTGTRVDAVPEMTTPDDLTADLAEVVRTLQGRVYESSDAMAGWEGTQYEIGLLPTKGKDGGPLSPRLVLDDWLAQLDEKFPTVADEILRGRKQAWPEREAEARWNGWMGSMPGAALIRQVGQLAHTAIDARPERVIAKQAIDRFTELLLKDFVGTADEYDQAIGLIRGMVGKVHDGMGEYDFHGFQIYRRMGVVSPKKFEKWAEEALEGLEPQWYAAFKAKSQAAGIKHPLAEAWREADNRVRAYFGKQPGGMASLVDGLYSSGAGRKAHGMGRGLTVFYHMARFLIDLRWLGLEVVEAPTLTLFQEGPAAMIEGLGKGKHAGSMPMFMGRDALETSRTAWAWWLSQSDPGALLRTREKYLLSIVRRRQMQEFPRALREAASKSPDLAAAIKAFDGGDEMAYLKRLDTDWELAASRGQELKPADAKRLFEPWYDRGIISQKELDELLKAKRYTGHPAIDRELSTLAEPWMRPLIDRLGFLNEQGWNDAARLIFGQTDRSNVQRLANHPLLYWPVSYQLKAAKWLGGLLFDRAFGIDTGSGGAVTLGMVHQQHLDRMRTDEQYANTVTGNPTLLFFAQMMFPIAPWDMGVGLSPFTRLAISQLTADDATEGYRRNVFSVGAGYTYFSMLPRLFYEQSKPGSWGQQAGILGDVFEAGQRWSPYSVPVAPKSTSELYQAEVQVGQGATQVTDPWSEDFRSRLDAFNNGATP